MIRTSCQKLATKWFLRLTLMMVLRTICVDSSYEPDCSKGCSQLGHKPHSPSIYEFMVFIHDDGIDYIAIKTADAALCDAQLARQDSFETYPLNSGPLDDIMVTDYTVIYMKGDGNQEQYSAINITYTFKPEYAGLVHAVNFTIRSASQKDKSFFRCRGYRFSTPLGMKDIQDDDGNMHVHYFDCLRGQRPGFEYEYTISLETISSSSDSKLYRFYHRTPACNFRPNDYFCVRDYGTITENDLPGLWKPQYFTVQSEEYGQILVQFEVAPDEYDFKEYDIEVINADGSQEGTVKKIVVNSSDIKETIDLGRRVRFIEVNLTDIQTSKEGSDMAVRITPAPCENSSCSETESRRITVYENPCYTEICGKNEKCVALTPGLGHECVCKDGFMEFVEGSCVENECYNKNPCEHGQCIPTSDGKYTCECYEDYVLHGGTCKLDLCAATPCSPHGDCKLHAHSNKLSYTCDCEENYVFNNTTCVEDLCMTSDPCGPNSAQCDVLVDPICTCNYNYMYKEGKGCVEDLCMTSDPCGPNSAQCDVLVDPICTCNYNYMYKEGKGCVVSAGILATIVVSGAMFVCIIILVVFCWRSKDKAVRMRTQIAMILPCIRSQTASVSVAQCPKCGFAWKPERPPGNEPLMTETDSGPPYDKMGKPQNDNDNDNNIQWPHRGRRHANGHGNPGGRNADIQMNDRVGQTQTCSSRTILKSVKTSAKLLILSATDDVKHSMVVEAFAHLLMVDGNKFSVALPSWDELQLAAQGWDTWLRDKVVWADKVIVVLPQATQRIGTPYRFCNENFQKGLDYINKILCGSQLHGNVYRKFQLVFFENRVPNTAHLPSALRNLPVYKLMEKMEALFFKLHDMEQYEPGNNKQAPWLKEDSYYETNEGFRLLSAIHNLNQPVNSEHSLPPPPSSIATSVTYGMEYTKLTQRSPGPPSSIGTSEAFDREFIDLNQNSHISTDLNFDGVHGGDSRDVCNNSLNPWLDRHGNESIPETDIW